MKYGHSAPIFHYRFDRNWVTPKSLSSQPQVNLTEQNCSFDSQGFVPQTLPDYGDDVGWYVDTGATNHVAFTMANLDNATTYTGPESVTVGDGKQLVISHVGHTTIPSLSSKPLTLQSVLHVPSIKKNLVSVSRLTKDNDVFIEFHKLVVLLRTNSRVLSSSKGSSRMTCIC